MAYTWNCPACHASIRSFQDRKEHPSAGMVYRCHRCRLELVFDPVLRMLTVKSVNGPREPI
jgi:predicted SprT family Zn-dependent metalloprotease